MGVFLGGGKGRVPQLLLDGTQVRTCPEEVGRAGVPQGMGMDVCDPVHCSGIPGDLPGGSDGQSAAPVVDEDRLAFTRAASFRQPLLEGECAGRAERHDAVPVSLARANADQAAVEVEVGLIQRDGLGHAETCAVQELEQGPIPQREPAGLGWAFHDLCRFIHVEKPWCTPRHPGRSKACSRRRLEESTLHTPPVERAKGGDPASQCGGSRACRTRLRSEKTSEVRQIGVQQ